MHTFHFPDPLPIEVDDLKNNFIAAATGIFFSVNNYTEGAFTEKQVEIIDDFFDSMHWADYKKNP